MAHFGGFFTKETYREEQGRVRSLLSEKARSPAHEHLLAYQKVWDRLTAVHTGYA
jgi:hypothetical protein